MGSFFIDQEKEKKDMAMKVNIDSNHFNEVYLPYLNNKERITVLYGGAGSGKSHFAVQKHVIKSLKYNKRRVLVIRKVQAAIRDSIFKLFVDQLAEMGIYPYCKVTTSNLSIQLPNGSEFIFKGLDDPEKIKSITGIDDILIEEATELTQDDFSQLNLRLRSGAENQQITLMFNPVSKENWVYPYFFKQKPRDTVILKTTYKHNRFLPEDYIKSLKAYQITNPRYYEIYCLGKFGNLGKQVFTNWKTEEFNVNTLVATNSRLKTCIGMDFGFTNDPTTIVFSLVDMKNKKLYIVDETYRKGLLNNEIAQIIHEKNYQKQVILADSAEPKAIEEIRGLGVPNIKGVKKGAGSINNGIQYMQQFEIIIHSSCEHTIAEFKDYSYKKDKKTGIHINEVTGADHCIDSIRYSLTRFSNGKSIRFLDKAVFGL